MPRSIDASFTIDARGALVIPTEVEYVRQRSVQALRFILGESFRRPDEGIPWLADTEYAEENPSQAILDIFDDTDLVEQLILNGLQDRVPEVTGVEVLSSEIGSGNRVLQLSLRLQTIYGDTEVDV